MINIVRYDLVKSLEWHFNNSIDPKYDMEIRGFIVLDYEECFMNTDCVFIKIFCNKSDLSTLPDYVEVSDYKF